MKKEDFLNLMIGKIRAVLARADFDFSEISEIRFRTDKPLAVKLGIAEFFLTNAGALVKSPQKAFCPGTEDIRDTLGIMANHSLYAHEEELKNGFLTLKGGHRLGICGQAVMDSGKVRSFKNIGSLNLRITREIKGCADAVIERIASPALRHVLIISPPACGKTTLLRDIIRQLSDSGVTIGLVDERSEIAGSYLGVPQNDVGLRTDVIDAAPKAEGMIMLLRAMSPAMIAVDEIGRKEDVAAIRELINAGVKIICTVHGNDMDDIRRRPYLSALLKENVFELFIVLCARERAGIIKGIFERSEKRK